MGQAETAARSLSEILHDLECATSETVLLLSRELMDMFLKGNSETEARDMVHQIMREHACRRGVHQPRGARIWGHNTKTGLDTWCCDWCGQRQYAPHRPA